MRLALVEQKKKKPFIQCTTEESPPEKQCSSKLKQSKSGTVEKKTLVSEKKTAIIHIIM